MRRLAAFSFFAVGVSLLLSGCLVSETPAPVYHVTAVPTVPAPTVADEPSPSAPPEMTTAPDTDAVPLDPDLALRVAIDALVAALGVPESSVIVVDSPLPVQWSDSSLGCPQPGQTYQQVVTPGYLVTLAVGDQTYHVHTDVAGTAVVCDLPGDPVGSGTIPDPVVAEFIDKARNDLAVRLGVRPEDIVLVRSEAVEWSDSSIGCREEGVDYVQVITFGYRIILAYDEQHYEYHTGQHQIQFCPNPTQ